MLTDTELLARPPLSPKQEAKLLREFPDPNSVQTTLDRLSHDDIVECSFPTRLALALWYHGFTGTCKDAVLPTKVLSILVASRIRRYVRLGQVSMKTKAGKVIVKYLHPEAKERSELVRVAIAERLGAHIPTDRTRKYSERPAVCNTNTTVYWGLGSVVVSADRLLYNKGTPYWTTKTYRWDTKQGWIKVANDRTFDELDPDMIQSKVIVRHLGDTASQYPNMSQEEFADVRALVEEQLGERGLVVWDLLARGSFTIRQIATVCSASDRFVYDVIEAARKGTGRDVVGDDDTRTGIEQASSRARYQTPAVQRNWKTERVPNTKPTLTERLQGITDCLTRPVTQTEPEQFDSFDDWYLHGTKNTRTSWIPVLKATKL